MINKSQNEYYRNIVFCILLTSFGYALCNVGDAVVKELASKFHYSQILVMTYLSVLVFTVIYALKTEGKKFFKTKRPKTIFAIILASQVVALCNTLALPHMQLTIFYTIVFTSPFLVAILGAYFLKDRLGKERLIVIIFSFLVIVFTFRPGSELFNIWTLLVLLSAFSYSAQLILIRSLGKLESRSFIIICRSIVTITIFSPILFFHYISPSPYEWLMFIMIGIIFSIAWLCIFYAFQHAPSATVVAPYHYTQIIWGALIGYFIFNDIPSAEVIIGASLIILSGLYLIYSEKKNSKTAIKAL